MNFIDPLFFKELLKEVDTKIKKSKFNFRERVLEKFRENNLEYLFEDLPKENDSPNGKNEARKKHKRIKEEPVEGNLTKKAKSSSNTKGNQEEKKVNQEVDLNRRGQRNASKLANNLILAQSKLERKQKLRRPDNADDLINDLKIKIEKSEEVNKENVKIKIEKSEEVDKENVTMPPPSKMIVKKRISKSKKIEKREEQRKTANTELKGQNQLINEIGVRPQTRSFQKSMIEKCELENFSTKDVIVLEDKISKIDLLDDSDDKGEKCKQFLEDESLSEKNEKENIKCLNVEPIKIEKCIEATNKKTFEKNLNAIFVVTSVKTTNGNDFNNDGGDNMLNATYDIKMISHDKIVTPLASSSVLKEIMTDDDDSSESDNSPLSKLKKPNTITKPNSVKKMIEDFENLKNTPNNENKKMKRSLFCSNSPKKNITKIEVKSLRQKFANDDVSSAIKGLKLEKKLTPKPIGTTPLQSVYGTRAVTKAFSVQKKEALNQIKIDEKRRKREEKQLKAQQTRIALERERQEELERQNQEKDEKIKQKLAARDEMLKKEALRKKEINALRAYEIEERRKAEEAQRLEKIQEQALLEQQRQAEYDETELLRKKRLLEHQADEQSKLVNLKQKTQMKSPQVTTFSRKLPVKIKESPQQKYLNQVFQTDDDEDIMQIILPNETVPLLEKKMRFAVQSKLSTNLITTFFQTTPEILEVSSIFPQSTRCLRDSSILWPTPPRSSMAPKFN